MEKLERGCPGAFAAVLGCSAPGKEPLGAQATLDLMVSDAAYLTARDNSDTGMRTGVFSLVVITRLDV